MEGESKARMLVFFDKDGTPLNPAEYGAKSSDQDYSTVGFEQRGDVTVSTVWLGVIHGLRVGAPLIFETMVFGGPYDRQQRRYPTLAEAEAGHAGMAERVWRGR